MAVSTVHPLDNTEKVMSHSKKLILSFETSCDETAVAVYDQEVERVLSSELATQIALHKDFGGVVPEISSRAHLKNIDGIVQLALEKANVTIDQIESIAVTSKPGLAGSLLIGFSYAKSLAWTLQKRFIGIDHNEGHIFSSYLDNDGSFTLNKLHFPFICLSVSGGHTSLYLVKHFNDYQLIGNTIDDAAGEAFDKTSKLIGLGYPGGPAIEKLAEKAGFVDSLTYPRTKGLNQSLDFSFSGLKTAILYDLIRRNYYDPTVGQLTSQCTDDFKMQVASSMLVCVGDIFIAKIKLALKTYPEAKGISFVGGVSANQYLRNRIESYCSARNVNFKASPKQFCTDNAAMIACAASTRLAHGESANWDSDIFR